MSDKDSHYVELRNQAQLWQTQEAHFKSKTLIEPENPILSVLYTIARKHARKYNHEAADYIFEKNNRNRSPFCIDLHGLYRREAEVFVKDRIVKCIRDGEEELHVIVGRGTHSQNGPVLPQFVAELCESALLLARVARKNPGKLIVDFIGYSSETIEKWASEVDETIKSQDEYRKFQPWTLEKFFDFSMLLTSGLTAKELELQLSVEQGNISFSLADAADSHTKAVAKQTLCIFCRFLEKKIWLPLRKFFSGSERY